MSVEKSAKLVEKLEELTNKGNINWEETEKANIFQVSFPDSSIRISKEWDREAEEVFYLLTLINEKGQELETQTDWTLRENLNDSKIKMAHLWDLARSKALGVEQALDKMLNQLDKQG